MIIIVAENTAQTQLFIDYIAEQVEHPVVQFGADSVPCDVESEKALVLLDIDHVSEKSMHQWHEQAVASQVMSLAVFNIRNENYAIDVLASLPFQGVFYRRDNLELICKGVDTLLEGGSWMSRSLMARLLELYRRRQVNTYRPAGGLTHRELEIIGQLGSGASNTEIADRLFISEHTVKSHLYNIFRKLDVHSRTQAMSWARQRQTLGALVPPRHQSKVEDIEGYKRQHLSPLRAR